MSMSTSISNNEDYFPCIIDAASRIVRDQRGRAMDGELLHPVYMLWVNKRVLFAIASQISI